jgi:hypothetical protein
MGIYNGGVSNILNLVTYWHEWEVSKASPHTAVSAAAHWASAGSPGDTTGELDEEQSAGAVPSLLALWRGVTGGMQHNASTSFW